MCGTIADIQSTAKNRQEKKKERRKKKTVTTAVKYYGLPITMRAIKKKSQMQNRMSASAMQGGHSIKLWFCVEIKLF